jgi:hypothetical protein
MKILKKFWLPTKKMLVPQKQKNRGSSRTTSPSRIILGPISSPGHFWGPTTSLERRLELKEVILVRQTEIVAKKRFYCLEVRLVANIG